MINKTVSLFRLYANFAHQAGGSPLIDRCFTREKEEPFRQRKGILIRLPFTGKKPTVGLVFGIWRKQ